MNFILFNQSTGQIIGGFECAPGDEVSRLAPGQGAIEGNASHMDAHIDLATMLVATGAIDCRSLDERKRDQWADVKAERSRLELATFTCAGLTYDCNSAALAGATLSAVIAKMAGAPWSQTWVLADNSVAVCGAR